MSRLIEDCNEVEEWEERELVIAPKRRLVSNFGPGPAKLPESVLLKAQHEFREFEHTGISILEMSHRAKEFTAIVHETEQLFRTLLEIPDNYKVLFLQGGGTGQFAAVPLNLLGDRNKDEATANYMVTGTWSKKGMSEGAKYLKPNAVFEPALKKYTRIPAETKLDENALFTFYCANETVHGVEYHHTPETPPNVPLVADMSSNILSKQIEVAKHGIIFAGTQKNIGAAGCTVVIVRDDLLDRAHPMCPSIINYSEQYMAKSVYNTPPVYSIYLTKLVLEWIKDQGGMPAMQKRSEIKSDMIYDLIDQSNGFYVCPVEEGSRSRMNIPFRIGHADGNSALETQFLDEAEKMDMISLKGHRSVGGIRVSLYNAVSVTETQKLAAFMAQFQETHSKARKEGQ